MTSLRNMISVPRKTLAAFLAGTAALGALAMAPAKAQAGHDRPRVSLDIRIGDWRIGQRHDHVAVERRVQVWVPAVYRTVCDRIWREPVYQDVCEQVLVPARYEYRTVQWWDGCGWRTRTEQVMVCPARWETQTRRVLVSPGRWETIERQELVSPGHWEWRYERVAGYDEGHPHRPVGHYDNGAPWRFAGR